MGGAVSISRTSAAEKQKAATKGKDQRRKNSFAFHLTKFIKNEENDVQLLYRLCKSERDSALLKLQKNNRDAKMIRIADAIGAGSMRELRAQVTGSFATTNRKYREHWFGDGIIHIICREGYLSMLEFLCDPKNHSSFDDTDIDFNLLNDRKRTPLHLCFTPPTLTYMAMLYGLDAKNKPITVKPEDVESLVDWIKPGGDEERQGLVALLMNQGANPNIADYHGFTALHYACLWGWAETVECLIEHNADINAVTISGICPLMLAVEQKHPDCVKALLSRGETLDKHCHDLDGVTPLILACEIKNEAIQLEIVEMLLKAEFDVDREDKKRRSALSIACKSNCYPLVSKLMDHKCRRRKSLFDLLFGQAAADLKKRLDNELRLAKELAEEMARLEKEKEEAGSDAEVDWRSSALGRQNPLGQWVQYKDKRGRGIFYYNTVSRESQWEEPSDYKFKKGAILRVGTYGMSFYH